MKQKLAILLFLQLLILEVKAQQWSKKELCNFFSYIIDSVIPKDVPKDNIILINSKTNKLPYTLCSDVLEKYIDTSFNESDKTAIKNDLRTAELISLQKIINSKQKN